MSLSVLGWVRTRFGKGGSALTTATNPICKRDGGAPWQGCHVACGSKVGEGLGDISGGSVSLGTSEGVNVGVGRRVGGAVSVASEVVVGDGVANWAASAVWVADKSIPS